MTRGGAGVLVALAMTAAIGLRAARLDERPMHHDEANQAIKFGALLERGDYRYDSRDHHGPTLYYLTLPSAWLGGRRTLASLDEVTLRRVPVVFGAATILLLPLLSPGIGRGATAAAAVLMALSPAMVFYSRMFIQEALLACFTLAFVIALGRIATGGGRTWWILAGAAAGLAASTKETSAIVLPAAVLTCAAAWWSCRSALPREARDGHRRGRWLASAGVGLAVALVIAAIFYTSFFTAPAAILEPFRGAGTYLARGLDPASHAHPWHYYVRLLAYTSSGGLTWSEGLVLVLAGVGAAAGWRPRKGSLPDAAFWSRYLACDIVIAGGVLSLIPYKTPWNLLPFYVVAFALAGAGFAALVAMPRSRAIRAAVVAALTIAALQLGQQAWRAAVTYAADPRNPYVYAQTVPDAVRLAARIRDLSSYDALGQRMQVSVIAPPYEQWPLPWYLRTMPNVGYWTSPGDAVALQAPVVVASLEHAARLDQALGDRYVSEFYGLRPDVVQALYVERGLWDRFLAHAK
jgi:uncharacterized protein (TIGR03663 family)